jgi:dipeptidyl aminopeptidase/acylaminoacyl peptidase
MFNTKHATALTATLLLATISFALADDAKNEQAKLIPLEVLFGNPSRAQARIAPDGSTLSWLAPSSDGVLNVWVQPSDRSTAPRQVTNDKSRGIRMHSWSQDGKYVLYVQDREGDENWRLYAVDLEEGVTRDLTPFEGVRAQNVITDPKHPRKVLVGLNKRDPSTFDMYRVDLPTGQLSLDTENPGDVVSWITDADFRIRAAEAADPANGDRIIRVRDSDESPWRELLRFPFGENGDAYGFDSSGERLFVTSSLGSDTTRLLVVDAATGNVLEELATNSKSDVHGVLVHPTEHRIQAVEFDYLKPEWTLLDDRIREDFAFLRGISDGTLSIASRSLADDRWIVAFEPDDGPVSYYLYQRESNSAEFLFVTRPELKEYQLAEMRPLQIPARDGLTLPGYLTLPAQIDSETPAKPLPTVLLVHGGPWARDTWGYDSQAQWLANRGYAVLQVNFRGSTGFGKAFLNAGNGEWGVGAMQHDLTDAVSWAIKQGIADAKRVCILGGSYGGYAVLAGLAFTPERYACGVDIVGPSHIKTLFESIPPYWAPAKKELLLRVGDVENDAELNHSISPFFHAHKIKVPLMVLQGANDPRVKIAESDQIVSAMRERGLPVTYIVFPDEGHGFARPENRLDANARIERFLADHLGGQTDPAKPATGSTAEMR